MKELFEFRIRVSDAFEPLQTSGISYHYFVRHIGIETF